MSEKIKELESAKPGMANGISTYLHGKITIPNIDPLAEPGLSQDDKDRIINKAAIAFGEFLTALGCDWKNDPNSNRTPYRVAKAYVNDLWKGRYELPPSITAFPSDGYGGMIQESNIPLTSMCSHHHQTIEGFVSIAYISSKDGKVIGLSKLNRIVEHFGRRGAIQEQLTVAIHKAVENICEKNQGVAVMINATHNCVQCRGVKHKGASMQTSILTGHFLTDGSTKAEFYKNIQLSNKH